MAVHGWKTHFEQIPIDEVRKIVEAETLKSVEEKHAAFFEKAADQTFKQQSHPGEGNSMVPKFDIFRIEADLNVSWLGSAATLDDAKSRAQEFAAHSRNGCLVLDQRTGNKVVVGPCDLL